MSKQSTISTYLNICNVIALGAVTMGLATGRFKKLRAAASHLYNLYSKNDARKIYSLRRRREL